MSASSGSVLGNRYTLTERVAGGGMGEVWEATDGVLGRTVAIKLLRSGYADDTQFVDRFRAEARHSAALSHPNIATVHDYGEEDGESYLVMELVPGEPLSRVITERGPLGPEEAASVLGQAAAALEMAHQNGFVHRDVKPANIILTPDGTAKLTDFGIARALHGSAITKTGEVMGTAQYISPEQAMGEPATPSSDIYALGIVAHEMLTGKRPFDAETPVATALSQVNDPPPPLPDEVPEQLRDLIESCLAKDPADRPVSAAAIAEELGVPVSGSIATAVTPPSAFDQTAVMATTVRQQDQHSGPATRIHSAAPAAVRSSALTDQVRKRPAVWGLAALAVIVLAVSLSRCGSGAAKTSTTPKPSPTRTATSRPVTVLSAAAYVGQPVDQVRPALESLGYQVSTRNQASGQQPGTVLAMSPTGAVPAKAVIMLVVAQAAPATTPAHAGPNPGNNDGHKKKGKK
ncbi:MAG: protein kinase domain-containing protein [Oryzihumus sp.]